MLEASTAGTEGGERMRRSINVGVLALALVGLMAAPALAQSGHFVGTQTCSDIGTQVECSGKVAGLGGTTFRIEVEADGIASVECANPAGNVAPGQSFDFSAEGSTGDRETPRNGQF